MHGSLGFMVNNHSTLRKEPKDEGGYCRTINPGPTCIMCHCIAPKFCGSKVS